MTQNVSRVSEEKLTGLIMGLGWGIMVGSGVCGVGAMDGAGLPAIVGANEEDGAADVELKVGAVVAIVGDSVVGAGVTGGTVFAGIGVLGIDVGGPRIFELFTSVKSKVSFLLAVGEPWKAFPTNPTTAITTPAMINIPAMPAANATLCRLEAISFWAESSISSADSVSMLSTVGFSSIIIVEFKLC